MYRWWVCEEAGTYAGGVCIETPNKPDAAIHIPTGAGGAQIHVILEIKDDNAIASLFDCRRIVIEIDKQIAKEEPAQQ